MESPGPYGKEETSRLSDLFGALKSKRAPWETLWQEIANYVMPRRSPGMPGASTLTPSTQAESRLFDTTAVQANMVLANGCLAWMSPMEHPWFAFTQQLQKKSDEIRKWLAHCTEVTRDAFANSSFYTAIHEFYLDRGAFGTGALYCEPGRRNPFNVQCWPVGTFVVDENDEGQVDTVIREFTLTPRQAAQKFGEGALSEKMRKALVEGGAKAVEPVRFLHFIMPRTDRDQGKMDAENMPIASIYMEQDGCHVCHKGGYAEMPVMVSRYLEWGTGMGSLYGWSPSFAALPEARQVNFLQKMMDALAEKAAFPPVMAPEELEGEIDPNASGVTYFSSEIAQRLPREWMTAGKYDIGKDRVMERQQAINRAFHVELFQMFSQLEKQMTAREVAERSSEKLIQFSPTFARLTTELFNPLLERAFSILLRNGQFADPPQGIISDRGGRGWIDPPQVQYSSRIALALRSLPTLGYTRAIERISVVAQFEPGILDNYNFDKAERASALNDGLPEDWIRPQHEVDAKRKARAEQQAQMMQMEQMQMGADALGKLGGIKADSPVAKIAAQQGGQAAA